MGAGGFKKLELDFLWEISNTLTKNSDENTLLSDLKNIFEKYLNVNCVRVIIKEESSDTLRDFAKNWIDIEQECIQKIFNSFQETTEKSFVLNNSILSYDIALPQLEAKFEQYLKAESNTLCFPIRNEKKIKGFLELNFDEMADEVKKSDFLVAIGISAAQISAVIMNRILNNQMLININFQNAMKNMAKIIETQYDLTYILPIIGEMMDKFVSNHLIYIFLKGENEEFKLIWPSDCKDERISALFDNFDDSKSSKGHIISPDSKAGLWAIKGQESIIGAIAASSSMDKLSAKDIEYITSLARQASITIEHANSYTQILQYATLDALTGLNNRRQFETRLNQEFSTAKRKHKPLCCIMLDIDHFKSVNDTYGHAAGDNVLRDVAQVIKTELREYDIASRYGGEEFCILLPFTVIKEAEFVAERLRSAVENANIEIPDYGILKVTISVGVSCFNEAFEYANVLYENADAALYEAKRSGRNRVVVYNEELVND